ncbi:MAG: hypothetical protein LBB81_07550, partial [Treponema sp.]|nr:hypothetical protein [Treponema sp.]
MNKLLVIISVLVIAGIIVIFSGRRETDYSVKYAGYELGGASTGRTNTYSRYLERYTGVLPAVSDIPVDIFSWNDAKGVSVLEEFEGEKMVLRNEEDGYIEYKINVDKAGMYNVYLEYFPLTSRGINIERRLKINGQVPFLGADRLVFYRVWGDGGNKRPDNQGNEIRPAQVEKPGWEASYFRDALGFITEPYQFYFPAGENTFCLEGINEPFAIRSLSLKAPVKIQSYREYLSGINTARFQNERAGFQLKIQGENAVRRSDPSLYPIYDRSSGATEPASVARIRLNMIGGDSWRMAGQWIEWEFNIP